jgi:clan AA aspartic protease
MISGAVNETLDAIVSLLVQDAGGQPHQIEAVVDTGFNGFLTLPPSLIASLGLAWLSRQEGELADGSIQLFDVFAATVVWDGRSRTIEVEATDGSSLLGMSLMKDHQLWIQVIDGGSVTISPLP